MKNSLILSVLLILLFSCKNVKNEDPSGKINIVTTTGMIGDAVKNVAGQLAEVTPLMGPGVDPHLYKATQGDLKFLIQADIIFYNGLHLEGKMGEVFEKLGRTKSVIPVTRDIPEQLLHKVAQFNNNYDPHIWFDLSIWRQTLDLIASELSLRYPEHEVVFRRNAQKYQSTLDSLHQWTITEIQGIPKKSRVLITAHDAFGYFGKAYDMEVKGLQGISTLSEFGLRDRVDLVELITERQIKAVFVETSVPIRTINSVVEACNDKGFNVIIGGSLYSDAMGEEGTPEGTFTGMFKANINTITTSLK